MCGGTAPKPTVVMDAGIATEENIAWLGEPGDDWIAVSRGGKPPPPEGGPEALLITSAHHEVRAWRLASEERRGAALCRQRGQEDGRDLDPRPEEDPLRGGAGKAPQRPPGQGPPQALRQGAGERRPRSSSASPRSPGPTRSRSRRRTPAPTRLPFASSAGRYTTRPMRAPAPMGCAPATSTGISRRSFGRTGASPTSRPPSAA